MKRGFTLVELSIVLVIIGLLIGGILVAQSMIETAKIETFIRQLQQIDAAVSNFQTKYNYLPGDAPQFGGNGDGSLYYAYFTSENANFWKNLAETGTLGGATTYSNTLTAAGIIYGTNIPAASIGQDCGIMVATPAIVGTNVHSGKNVYGIAKYDGRGSIAFWNDPNMVGCTTALEAMSLDNKIDDGDPSWQFHPDGKVKLFGKSNVSGVQLGNYDLSGLCDDGAGNYRPSNPGYNCAISIVMLSQVGQN